MKWPRLGATAEQQQLLSALAKEYKELFLDQLNQRVAKTLNTKTPRCEYTSTLLEYLPPVGLSSTTTSFLATLPLPLCFPSRMRGDYGYG